MINKTDNRTRGVLWYKATVNYRAAQLLLDHGCYDAANDRAFFCMYYSAIAILTLDDINETKTDAVINHIEQLYVIQRNCGSRLIEVFETARKIRNEGIYDHDLTVTQEDAEQSVKDAEYFFGTLHDIMYRRVVLKLDLPVKRCDVCGQTPRTHNERGAGRKSTVPQETANEIMELYREGLSQAVIAAKLTEKHGVHIGRTTVGKIIRKVTLCG